MRRFTRVTFAFAIASFAMFAITPLHAVESVPSDNLRTRIAELARDDFHANQVVVRAIVHEGERALPALLDALAHANVHVRRYAAQAIGEIGVKTDAILDATLRSLAIEREDAVRANLIFILDTFNDSRAFAALARVLADLQASEDLRYRAAYAIARLGNRQSFEVLREYLRDPSGPVRNSAIWGIGLSKVMEGVVLVRPIFEEMREPIVTRYWAGIALRDLGETVDLERFRQEVQSKLVHVRQRAGYTIHTDLPAPILDEVEALFTRVDTFNRAFFRTDRVLRDAPTTILLFRAEEDFRSYTQMFYPDFASSGGGYVPSEGLLFTYDRPDNPDRLRQLLRHEWTHRFIHHAVHPHYWDEDYRTFVQRYPIWFDEGFAEVVSYADFDRQEPRVVEDHAVELVRLVREGKLPKIRDLIRDPDPYQFGIRYAESWGLMHFLLRGVEGKYRPVIDRLIEALREERAQVNDLAVRLLGDLDRVDREWAMFITSEWSALATPAVVAPASSGTRVTCTDSDPSDAPAIRGELSASDATVFWHGYRDYCVDAHQLIEMRCDAPASWYTFTAVDCAASGATCAEGACVPSRGTETLEGPPVSRVRDERTRPQPVPPSRSVVTPSIVVRPPAHFLTLGWRRTGTVRSGTSPPLMLQFTRLIADRRCAQGTTCATPGAVTVELRVRPTSRRTWERVRLTLDPRNRGKASAVVRGHRIELRTVTPERVRGQRISPPRYTITVAITPILR